MKILLFIPMIFFSVQGFSQEIARFTVFAGDADRLDCPVGISLDQINYNRDGGTLSVLEIAGDSEVPISCQLETGHSTRLWIILSGETPKGSRRNFILRQNDQPKGTVPLKLQKRHGQLRLSSLERPVLDYQFETMYPPEGIDPLFKRSGFIHPLWSPEGQVLSRVQPPDHYHHYGIWGPWTKTHIKGREVDFWNLLRGHGTVQFSGFLSEVEGQV